MIMDVYCGQVLDGLRRLATNSVHCVFMSPPYWMVRDYLVDGQLGREATLAEHVANLVEVMRGIRRVLHPSGLVWFNYGHLWAQNGQPATPEEQEDKNQRAVSKHYPSSAYSRPTANSWNRAAGTSKGSGLAIKQSLMLPERLGLAFQEDGWWNRGLVVWEKPNGLSGSIKDRPASNHEAIYQFAKSPRYFYDVHQVRNNEHRTPDGWIHGTQLRAVWRIPTRPSRSGHCATFPLELPRRGVLLSTSVLGCCPECLAPVKPVYVPGQPDVEAQRRCGGDANGEYSGQGKRDYAETLSQDPSDAKRGILRSMRPWKLVGANPGCRCLRSPDHAIPCTVLDPFSGEGTTGEASLTNGRLYRGIELNAKDVEFQEAVLGPKARLLAQLRKFKSE